MTHAPKPSPALIPHENLPVGWEVTPLDPNDFLHYVETNITPGMLIDDRPGQAKLAYVLGRRFYRGERTLQTIHIGTGEPTELDNETDLGLIHNPAPVIELRHGSGDGDWQSSTFIHEVFRLKEDDGDKHYYFFSAGNPIEEVPAYLRPTDIVPSGTYSQTFPSDARQRMKDELGIDEETFQRLRYHCDPILAEYQVLVDIPFNKPLERVPASGGQAELYNYVDGVWEPSGGDYDPGFKAKLTKRLRNIIRPNLQATSLPELLELDKS